MEVLGIVICILAILAGLVLIIFSAGGTLVIFAGALIYAFLTDFQTMTVRVLIILFGISVFGELLEFVSGMFGAKKFGASRTGMVAALVGGIAGGLIGTLFLPVVGSIIGALLGTFTGAVAGEKLAKEETGFPWRAGVGAFIGRM